MATRLRCGCFQNRTVNPKVDLRSENQSSTCDVLILLLVCMSVWAPVPSGKRQ